MEMININIQVQPEMLITLNKTADEFGRDLKVWAAISLYQYSKISLAKAARLAGYHRYDFEKLLAGLDIPISKLTIDDIKKDMETINLSFK
jgi:predicted HTH domain antitoxin